MAGLFAFRDAMEKSSPVLLEPAMSVEVETPDEYQGDIMGDLNRRRGQIRNIANKGSFAQVSVLVPLAEMFGYSTTVRSPSKGRASYSMEPECFEEVPPNVRRRSKKHPTIKSHRTVLRRAAPNKERPPREPA